MSSSLDSKYAGTISSPRKIALLSLTTLLAIVFVHAPALGYDKESPEVRAMVDKGKAYLEKHSEDPRLGAKCLVAIVFIKEGEKDHALVKIALDACREAAAKNEPEDVYSNGLAIIFLAALDAKAHRNQLQFFLNAMQRRQKPHGGWGYDVKPTGDTSQSQYGCLGSWEAFQKGMPINVGSIDGVANWLINTQDPSGAWGYQGKVGSPDKLEEQEEITCSMVAAAMGSILICADLVGILKPHAAEELEDQLPTGFTVSSDRDNNRPRLGGSSINPRQLLLAVQRGNAWMDKNYEVEIKQYTSYYMYALERYKSLAAILDGNIVDQPVWYNNGVEYLMKTQSSRGSWDTGCGEQCDTAFSILFLIRSMESELNSLEGSAIAGRGVPVNISNLKVSGNDLVAQQAQTEIDEIIGDLDDEKLAKLEGVINGSGTLNIGNVDEKSIRRLKQVVRSGEPAARIVAVKALAQTGDFDHVPTLLYALADTDKTLARTARDGLRFVSRRFEGFGLKDNFSRAEQLEAVDKWVKWYSGVRPDVPVVLE
ncbi:hypothetical protein [Aeoliella mucimassa]|uniref:Prenyltransferase and squalene oxidase repeat protein n=1 Tax=Aeoliella mucimassa TaxID=2527972 RepID=A0A518AP55_9BACT|nr:hypothetical protein [Aeoliella mucimassa]QDU56503.1 hypothetical protein Pan181_27120 [Aeoliella mucimassa]